MVQRSRLTLVITAILLTAVAWASPFPVAAQSDVREDLARFKAKRREMLEALIVPIEQCVRRRDTQHVAFHGCIDWHSSVHGTWALVKYTGLTGDRRYVPLIDKVLRAANVVAEQRYVEEHPAFELPYGRAWFLRLAIDDKTVFGSDRLTAMANSIARSLVQHYRDNAPDPLAQEYLNPSWALINLYDYGVSRNNEMIVDFVRATTRKHFVGPAQHCPIESEQARWQEFMPVCAMWAYLVARTETADDLRAWLARSLPLSAMRPIARDGNSYRHMAMNFSRGWALWPIYKTTNDPRYLRLYLDQFTLQFETPAAWKGDYREVGHWVAQFGVFALAPVFSD